MLLQSTEQDRDRARRKTLNAINFIIRIRSKVRFQQCLSLGIENEVLNVTGCGKITRSLSYRAMTERYEMFDKVMYKGMNI